MILKNIIIVSLVISASFLTLSVKANNSDSLERLGEVDPKSSYDALKNLVCQYFSIGC